MDCSLPGSSVHGITGVSCHFLLQGIFMTQGLNLSLLHCRQMLYQLSHQGQKYWGCDKLGNIQVESFSLKTTYSSHFSSSFHSLSFSLSFSLCVSLFLSLPYPPPHTHPLAKFCETIHVLLQIFWADTGKRSSLGSKCSSIEALEEALVP